MPSVPQNIVDPFHRQLYELLAKDLENRASAVASGACASFEDYRRQVGYIEALNDVMDKCRDIEADIHGTQFKNRA